MYTVQIPKRVGKEIRQLPPGDRARVLAVLRVLAETPRPRGCLPVENAPAGTYRLRVGDYRIVYIVLDEDKVIVVVRVARRREDTYRRLG